MSSRLRVVPTLLAALFILALPATASAAVYTVDSTADEADVTPGVGGCLTAGGKCTLRAAIQESNFSEAFDDIAFAATFDGKTGDAIALTLGDLPILKAAEIAGFTTTPCDTSAGIKGPCVEVSGGGFNVESSGVTIRGVAVNSGGGDGIDVFGGRGGFVAEGNWLGFKLDGTAGGNSTGIFVDPGSNGAIIGDDTIAERNVIGNSSSEGLDLEGASNAVIRGNYFGVGPNGSTPAPNGKNIEITDSLAGTFPAENIELGEVIEEPDLGTSACDGGCNVISGATGTGLDLNGNGAGENEAPATGPTTVHGNYVGLNAAGTAAVPNGLFGVLAGGADDVTVGGFESGELNRITGGGFGVYGENGDDLIVRGNVIGLDATAGVASPPTTGVFMQSLGISGPEAGAEIANNTIFSSDTGVEQRFTGAEISGNFIVGGSTGILTLGSSVGEGNFIAGNRVREVTGNGIRVENDSNVLIANEVLEAGEAGILVKYAGTIPTISESTGNLIGGEEEFEENEIVSSGGPAIEIRDLEKTNNEVARNNGEGNGGLFIDLVKAEPTESNGPNEGIQPPAINALASSASGTAQPGATVRVFRKASPEAGELASFLGEAKADGSGNWKVSYGSIPVGTIVAATQTSAAAGTSELATTTSIAGPIVIVDGGCAFLGNCPKPGDKGNAGDKTPPQTKMLKAPPKKTTKTTAKFKFSSSEAGSSFQCKLDRKPFKSCRSPKTYKSLKPGKHVFKVRAIDKAGNVDGSPAKRKFTVLG